MEAQLCDRMPALGRMAPIISVSQWIPGMSLLTIAKTANKPMVTRTTWRKGRKSNTAVQRSSIPNAKSRECPAFCFRSSCNSLVKCHNPNTFYNERAMTAVIALINPAAYIRIPPWDCPNTGESHKNRNACKARWLW